MIKKNQQVKTKSVLLETIKELHLVNEHSTKIISLKTSVLSTEITELSLEFNRL